MKKMGRKPNAFMIIDKVPTPENPSLERVEPQAPNANMTMPGAVTVDSQVENSNPVGSPLKNLNPLVDEAVTHKERSPEQEQINQCGLQKKSSKYTSKKYRSVSSSVRRSERIKSGVVNTYKSNRGAAGVIECIDAGSESEKDEPATQMEVEQVVSELEPEAELEREPEPAENLGKKRSDEKFEAAYQRIEDLEKITEFLKSRVDELTGSYGAPSMAPISYQSLYMDSQKKIEALTAKLENALGKIEVYEKDRHVLLGVLDKMKDSVNAVLVSSLAKATEAAVNASNQAMRHARSASAAKRKRNAQES